MIQIQNVEKQYGSKILYDKISVNFFPGNRYGLVGINGSGKSVLLRLIVGEEGVDKGDISISNNISIGYLPQDMEVVKSINVMDMVLEPFKYLLNIESSFEKISTIKDTNSIEYKKAESELSNLQAEIDKHDAYSLPSRAAAILSGLGVAESTWNEPVTNLSGGYRMRVVLSRLLLTEPDFLLMDEPTNHLDMDSLIWLERFLQKFKGGMLLVSHDRDFLNRTITHTLEIEYGNIYSYTGNLRSYYKWKEEVDSSEEKRHKNLSDKIEKMERFVTRFKAQATKASQAQSRMKQLEKLKAELPKIHKGISGFNFRIPPSSSCGSVPIKFDEITSGYGESVILNRVSLTITRGEKLAVIGPNGSGKSTFLKTITGMADLMSGEFIKGHNADIRYFSQHRLDELDLQSTLYETVASVMGDGSRKNILSLLGAFLFRGDEVDKMVEVLSGGEKSRLSLLLLLINPGNVLLLDEPTNHLDIQSIETVANALSSYDGTVIIVSHDEYFISQIADRIIEIRPGQFRDFPGTITEYRNYIEEGIISSLDTKDEYESNNKTSDIKVDKKERVADREKRKKLERSINKIEKNIASTEKKVEELTLRLNDPAKGEDHNFLSETQENINIEQDRCGQLLIDWERLSALLEEL